VRMGEATRRALLKAGELEVVAVGQVVVVLDRMGRYLSCYSLSELTRCKPGSLVL